jgi:hypothetical protein
MTVMFRVRAALFVLGIALATGVATQAPAPVYLSVSGRASADAWVAADGARVAVAWGARAPGGDTEVYTATSSDGGRSFGAPARVSDGAGTARINGEMAPRVVFVPRAGQAPAVDVLWIDRGSETAVRIARSNDRGRTFGASRPLQKSGSAGDRGWAALTADAHGVVHAIWLDHRGMTPAARDGDHHHGHDAAASTAAAGDGAAAAQKSALYYSDSRGERELIKGVCYCCKTALVASTDGTLYAAWRQVYAGNMRDIAFSMSRDGGRTFTPPGRVSEDRWQLNGCPDDGPAMAVDRRGTAHIVWPTVVTEPVAHKALFYATTRDGRSFAARTRVSPMRRNIAHPQIALGPGGEIAVFWDEIVSGRRRVFVSRLAGLGLFGAAESLSDGMAASYPVPAVADGGFVVAWTEGSGDGD